jgi:hypothetical protein
MGSSNQGLRTTATEQATISDLKALRSKVIDTLEAILFLSLSYIRDQILTNDMSRVESCRRTFTFALDQTSLDFLVSFSGYRRLKIITPLQLNFAFAF